MSLSTLRHASPVPSSSSSPGSANAAAAAAAVDLRQSLTSPAEGDRLLCLDVDGTLTPIVANCSELRREHVTRDQILAFVRTRRLEDGVVDAVRRLHREGTTLVAVSGGLDVYVVELLKAHGIYQEFSAVYANRGVWGGERGDMLYFHSLHGDQTGCPMSCRVICKSLCVRDFQRRAGVRFRSRGFIGDARPDCCPMLLELGAGDTAFTKGQGAADALQRLAGEKGRQPRCAVVRVDRFADVLEVDF